MFDIGFPELILILVIALLVFGPGKMAEIGRELGKGIRQFRQATTDITREFNDALKVEDAKKAEAGQKTSEQESVSSNQNKIVTTQPAPAGSPDPAVGDSFPAGDLAIQAERAE